MNKIKSVALAALFVIGFTAAQAQGQKSAYMSVEQMVYLMPEIPKIDTMLQRYQADSLNTAYVELIRDYQYRDSVLRDTSKMPPSVIRQHRQELEATGYQIQNWQQISQEALRNKQQELLNPVYVKVMDAVRTVAKENGYGFVYNQEALLVAPPADNLFPMVAKKLNVKLPTQAGGTAPAGTTPRPNAGAGTRPRAN